MVAAVSQHEHIERPTDVSDAEFVERLRSHLDRMYGNCTQSDDALSIQVFCRNQMTTRLGEEEREKKGERKKMMMAKETGKEATRKSSCPCSLC